VLPGGWPNFSEPPQNKRDQDTLVGQTMHSASGQAAFPTTRWTLIASAGNVHEPDNRRALESLCAAYWYPLYAFVRRRGDSPEQAQDHTQDFFARSAGRRLSFSEGF
jgi:hypothetical protein